MALADFQQMVDDLVRDQSGTITAPVRDRAIVQALVRYSADCLRTVVVDVTWLETGVFGPVPEGWDEGAFVKSAQHAGQPVYIDRYRTPEGWGLECLQVLTAGAVVRLTYTTGHLLTETADTVPLAHRLPVASHAAWQLCSQLATYYSGQRETLINADHSNTESRARDYAARAKEYRSAYFVGTEQPDPYAKPAASNGSGVTAASAVVSWPGRPRNRLTRGVL